MHDNTPYNIGNLVLLPESTYGNLVKHDISRGSGPNLTMEETLVKLFDWRLAGNDIWRLDGQLNVRNTGVISQLDVTYLYLIDDQGERAASRPVLSIRRDLTEGNFMRGNYRKIGFDEAANLVRRNWERRYYGQG